ncbi:response regulator [Fibrella forsythiae]|uniref:Response regulator transcription factor n=1 Tax=Fibrella forsythiae TaxID=2817061 RepID=A0ABS3JV05_9BACT|nr:response regulator transcription factor [Fibrella forsythiae]MBO0953024.1 response regulator transcription factor [Fibrella forsythiae]
MHLAQSNILIADDHRMFNDAIAGLLRPLAKAVWQAFEGGALLHAVQQYSPNLLLLDINMPGINGIEAARIVRQHSPDLKILLITMYNHTHFVKEAESLQLNGYLLKDSPSEVLFEGIDAALAGRSFFDPKLQKSALTEQDAFTKGFSLTRREKEVIQGLVAGQSAEQIAAHLCISYETVKSHRKNIYLKLGINTIVDLMHLSRQQGWGE